ncbi:MAG: DUF6688 family protein [Pirellulales bacterium]
MENEEPKSENNSKATPSVQTRVLWLIAGVVLPAIAFLLMPLSGPGFGSNLGSKLWQSGSIRVYADLMLDKQVVPYFHPFIALAMIGLSVFCKYPTKSSGWVGLLLVSGFALYIQIFILLVVAVDNYIVYGPLNAVIVGILLQQLVRVGASVRRFSIGRLFLFMTLVAFPIGLLANFLGKELNEDSPRLTVLPVAVLHGALISAPLLALWAYASAFGCFLEGLSTKELLARLDRYQWSSAVAWLIGYAAAWKLAIDTAILLYSQLPKSKPNCYVSTAAASGHKWLVGSEVNSQGQVVNGQMRHLKVAELLLAMKVPKIHRQIRLFYNRFGPVAAARIVRRPWLADLTYLSLLPLEFTTRVLLKLLRVDPQVISKLYE